MIYMIRRDPQFQANNLAVDYQVYLMTEWANIGYDYTKELDIF